MATVLLVVHIMIALALIVIVLMQRSEGGALGVGGGGGGFMTGRGTANLLTRMTAVLALCFFITSILLTILANRGPGGSIFDRPGAAGGASAPATGVTPPTTGGEKPAGGTVLDSLSEPARTPLPSVPGTR